MKSYEEMARYVLEVRDGYEKKKRRGRRKICGSHEPLNVAHTLLDDENNEFSEEANEQDNTPYIDDPQELSIKYMAEIVGRRLAFPGSLADFCKKYNYNQDDVVHSLGKAGSNITKLLTIKR